MAAVIAVIDGIEREIDGAEKARFSLSASWLNGFVEQMRWNFLDLKRLVRCSMTRQFSAQNSINGIKKSA